jgi:hypothetical protein
MRRTAAGRGRRRPGAGIAGRRTRTHRPPRRCPPELNRGAPATSPHTGSRPDSAGNHVAAGGGCFADEGAGLTGGASVAAVQGAGQGGSGVAGSHLPPLNHDRQRACADVRARVRRRMSIRNAVGPNLVMDLLADPSAVARLVAAAVRYSRRAPRSQPGRVRRWMPGCSGVVTTPAGASGHARPERRRAAMRAAAEMSVLTASLPAMCVLGTCAGRTIYRGDAWHRGRPSPRRPSLASRASP